jgi:thiol:disulfide interchange protein DsbD
MEVFYSIFFGFSAGVLLNFMPCILPIIFLKINSFTHAINKNEARLIAFSTIIGILSFVLVVASIFLAFEGLSWGFWLQSPNFISALLFLLNLFFFLLKVQCGAN